MSSPSAVHPVTGRPRKEYVTLVIERCSDTETGFPIADITNSLAHGKESKTFPGYRVHDMSHGDYIATALQATVSKEDRS